MRRGWNEITMVHYLTVICFNIFYLFFQHIYHTVAIEGNSMTPSQTRSIVETRMAIAGKSIVEHNEILGLDAAMKYINATLVNK